MATKMKETFFCQTQKKENEFVFSEKKIQSLKSLKEISMNISKYQMYFCWSLTGFCTWIDHKFNGHNTFLNH
jgi:hypothetical protein